MRTDEFPVQPPDVGDVMVSADATGASAARTATGMNASIVTVGGR